jgi:hypothetical protein
LRFEHYDLAIHEVFHYGLLIVHFTINQLQDPTVGFWDRIQNNKMNS